MEESLPLTFPSARNLIARYIYSAALRTCKYPELNRIAVLAKALRSSTTTVTALSNDYVAAVNNTTSIARRRRSRGKCRSA